MYDRISATTNLQLGQVIYELVGSEVRPYVAHSAGEALRWGDKSNSVCVSEFDQRMFFADETTALKVLYDIKRTLAESARQEANEILARIQRKGEKIEGVVARPGPTGELPEVFESVGVAATAVAFDPVASLSRGELRAVQPPRGDGSIVLERESKWGFGKSSQGGTGGDFYLVDTLEDTRDDTSGSPVQGSLRRGIETASGPRTIRFLVNGNIVLKSPLQLRSRLSILGPESGSRGLRIVGNSVFARGLEHLVIKNIGFRHGGASPNDQADAFEASNCKNVFIDRCSFAWSVDECCSLYNCEDCTLQRSIIAYSLKNAGHSKGAHALAGIYRGTGISLIGNLFAHHQFRPNIIGTAQVVNCVFYNYEGKSYPVSMHTDETFPSLQCDLEECEFRAGPCTSHSSFRMVRIDGDFLHSKRADNRPGRTKRFSYKGNEYFFLDETKPSKPMTKKGIKNARPNVNADIVKDDPKFPALRDPEILLMDPATQAGPTIPDALDIKVREDYVKRQIAQPGRTTLIDSPQEVIPAGINGL